MATILIVDDEPDVLESTALLLESLGHRAVRLDDAAAVLETTLRERPDLILHDLRMPNLNLAGLAAALRSHPQTSGIPLVFFSAGSELAAAAARYGAWGYLGKPFGRGELVRLLAQALPGGAAGPRQGRDLKREVDGLCHDILELVTAAGSYLRVVEAQPGLEPAARRGVRGLEETLLKTEAKATRLRRFVAGLVGAIEAVPEPDRSPTAPAPEGQAEPQRRLSRPPPSARPPARQT